MRKLEPTGQLKQQFRDSPVGKILNEEEYKIEYIRYEKKEDLNLRHPAAKYLKFILSGTVKLWMPKPDGGQFRLYEESGFCVLGDMELLDYKTQLLHEAVTTVVSAELYVPDCEARLMENAPFLRFLAANASGVISQWLPLVAIDNLKDRLLYYLSAESGGTLCSLDQAATRLNCSNRQLHRVLAQLQEEGTLVKNSRGQYALRVDA